MPKFMEHDVQEGITLIDLKTINALSLALSHVGDFKEAIEVNNDALELTRVKRLQFWRNPVTCNRVFILTYPESYKDAQDKCTKEQKTPGRNVRSSHVGIVDCPNLEAYLLFISWQFDLAEKNCQPAPT
jgi:hypothetical protein